MTPTEDRKEHHLAALRSALDTRTTSGLARLIGLGGTALTLAGLALTLLVWALVDIGGAVPERMERALTTDALLALLALFGILISVRRPLLASPVLLLAFAGSFAPGFGWYFVLAPSPLAMPGAGGLLYGAAAVIVVVAGIARRGAVREEGRS